MYEVYSTVLILLLFKYSHDAFCLILIFDDLSVSVSQIRTKIVGLKRACGVNFCRTFIWSISLFLELAGSKFGTYTTQPSQSCMALVIFVRYACKCQKMAALRIGSFPCDNCINAVLTGLNSTRQRIQVKFKAKIVNL